MFDILIIHIIYFDTHIKHHAQIVNVVSYVEYLVEVWCDTRCGIWCFINLSLAFSPPYIFVFIFARRAYTSWNVYWYSRLSG